MNLNTTVSAQLVFLLVQVQLLFVSLAFDSDDLIITIFLSDENDEFLAVLTVAGHLAGKDGEFITFALFLATAAAV